MLSVVAERDADGFYEWRLPDGVLIVGGQGREWVTVYYGQGSLPIRKKHLANAFKVFLYPPGTVLVDESDSAKLRRNKMYSAHDIACDIPRKDIYHE